MSKTSRGQYFLRNGGTLSRAKHSSGNFTISLSFMFLCIFNGLLKLNQVNFCNISFYSFDYFINNLDKAGFWSTQIGTPIGYPIWLPCVFK